MLALDHVVLAVRSLDDAAARLEREHGLASYPGGRHAHGGTENRIVPLRGEYLELMALAQPEAARGWGLLVAGLTANGDSPALWCVRTDDLDGVAHRLGLVPEEWERRLPDGSALRWRLAGTAEAVLVPTLPFFIEWEDERRHPARTAVPHRGAPERIAWLELAGDADRLREWLGGAELPVDVVAGEPELRAVAVAAAGGEIVLRAGL